jgi:S-formylglutathione hydrolase FrmB
MALVHCDFFSEVLGLCTSMCAILPQPAGLHAQPHERRQPLRCPVLYLLHGLSDDHTTWLRRTSIERHVDGLGLAVIMPAVHRSFYTDMAIGYRYGTFVSEELPALAQAFFPLSAARDDTFVAGLSMGGYGAFKLALRHPERYAAAASLSGALDVAALAQDPNLSQEMRLIFKDPAAVAGTADDLFHLASEAGRSARPRPRLYQCCGTEDLLYGQNVRFRRHAEALHLDLTYEEGPGAHDWGYWDQQIRRVLAWLPLRSQPSKS